MLQVQGYESLRAHPNDIMNYTRGVKLKVYGPDLAHDVVGSGPQGCAGLSNVKRKDRASVASGWSTQ